MKKKNFVLILVAAFVIPFYAQAQEAEIFLQEGIASWYGREYDGRPTASGEIFDSSQFTAAHPSLPFGTWLVVTNLHNNKKVTVRVNDRGPFVAARIIDISRMAAEQLDMIVTGTAPVKVESIDRIAVSVPVSQSIVTGNANVVSPISTPAETALPSSSAVVYIAQTQTPSHIKLHPEINIIPGKRYRLQVGSYKIARNAVEAFEKLKNSGLNPAYERYTDNKNEEYFRVVLAGIGGTDIELTAERILAAGFWEALIREEN